MMSDALYRSTAEPPAPGLQGRGMADATRSVPWLMLGSRFTEFGAEHANLDALAGVAEPPKTTFSGSGNDNGRYVWKNDDGANFARLSGLFVGSENDGVRVHVVHWSALRSERNLVFPDLQGVQNIGYLPEFMFTLELTAGKATCGTAIIASTETFDEANHDASTIRLPKSISVVTTDYTVGRRLEEVGNSFKSIRWDAAGAAFIELFCTTNGVLAPATAFRPIVTAF